MHICFGTPREPLRIQIDVNVVFRMEDTQAIDVIRRAAATLNKESEELDAARRAAEPSQET